MDDVLRLCRRPELLGERLKCIHLRLLLPSASDDVVKLHTQHDLTLWLQLVAQSLRHRRQILLLAEGFAKLACEIGINGLRIIVAQKAERGIHLLLHDHAILL